jgi:hypothetical protein
MNKMAPDGKLMVELAWKTTTPTATLKEEWVEIVKKNGKELEECGVPLEPDMRIDKMVLYLQQLTLYGSPVKDILQWNGLFWVNTYLAPYSEIWWQAYPVFWEGRVRACVRRLAIGGEISTTGRWMEGPLGCWITNSSGAGVANIAGMSVSFQTCLLAKNPELIIFIGSTG